MKATQEKIKVLLVDDHPLVTEGVGAYLDLHERILTVGTANDGVEAQLRIEQLNPDVALIDINMPEMNGLQTLSAVREGFPHVRCLVLSMHNDKDYVLKAMRNGASGYILKDVPIEEIATAILVVHSGGTYLSAGISNALLDVELQSVDSELTAREQGVLAELADGYSNKEVALNLDISVRTVETHRKNIRRKLGISSTAGLIRYAMDNDLTD